MRVMFAATSDCPSFPPENVLHESGEVYASSGVVGARQANQQWKARSNRSRQMLVRSTRHRKEVTGASVRHVQKEGVGAVVVVGISMGGVKVCSAQKCAPATVPTKKRMPACCVGMGRCGGW